MKPSILLTLAFTALLAVAQSRPPAAPATQPAGMRRFETPHYIMYTDLDDDSAREAWVRMTKMFETYQRRTAGFSGTISSKFPFYLYRHAEDYKLAGGPRESAGVFKWDSLTGGRLLAIAGDDPDGRTWHIIQHEGFHQFARAVIRGELPIWLNEGLAEYFGEGVFTGDDIVTGLIRNSRLEDLQDAIRVLKGGKTEDPDAQKTAFKPLGQFMYISAAEWSGDMRYANYTEAWSMVHFLAHGDDGKYQKAFVAYMNALGRGQPAQAAWDEIFGRDTLAFQKKWEEWWLAQEPGVTADQYRRAQVMTWTGLLARATSQGQKFATAEDLAAAAAAGKIKWHADDWLPPSLLAQAVEYKSRVGKFTLQQPKGYGEMPRLVCETPTGRTIVGTFTISGGRVRSVNAELQPAATPPGK